jgi:nitrite reductase/ring-hydroxylating ferredoxin subunit
MTRETLNLDGEVTRRTLIIRGGLCVLALGTLSACTNYGSGSGTPSQAGSTSAGTGAGVSTAKADIPVGSGKIFAEAQTVITQPKSGQFKAFTAICTHQQCTVAEVTDTINCNCHGSKFSITDGSVVNGPAQNPLAAKTVTASGDKLTVSG